MPLSEVNDTAGYLKAGFLGFAGSGKTHTAMELAIGAREFFRLDGPIAMFDTEDGSSYWAKRILERTGKKLLVMKGRSLDSLMETAHEATERGCSVFVADSVTHPWREVCDAYLAELQKNARERKWRVPTKLEFQDWNPIKARWGRWTDWYLTSPMHVVVCGRAGHEYEHEEDDRGKKQLIKSGIKMKTEAEFGFEPSLLVEMYREQDHDTHVVTPRAHILKDRFDLIDGKEFEKPNFETFLPHVKMLAPESHAPVDTTSGSKFQLDDQGRTAWESEKKRRGNLAEEIEHIFTLLWPGQSAVDKRARAAAAEMHWPGTKSMKALLEDTRSDAMAAGLESIREAMSEQLEAAKAATVALKAASQPPDAPAKSEPATEAAK